MTDPAQSSDVVPGRSRGLPDGELPRWRRLYEEMTTLKPGDLIRYEEMGELLGLDFRKPKDMQLIHAAARKAADELRRREKKVCGIVRGHGYQVAQPELVIALARRHQTRAIAEVEAGAEKIDAIDLSQVDVTTARLIMATAMGFAQQAGMMRQLDVRQKRLETAMAAVNHTAQTAINAVEQTSHRVDATQTELQQIQQRLTELEANQPGKPHTTSSLRP